MSKRIKSFDFVRATCAIGILANHFAVYSQSDLLQKYLYTFPNGYGSFGYTIVTVFLLISGGLLYFNHKEIGDIRRFYTRRWLAIFPPFYLGSLGALVVATVLIKDYLSDKHVSQLLFTLVGFDGYLSNYFDTWLLVGGWFIGAIILCYIFYPVLLKGCQRYELATSIVMVALYVITYRWDMFNQHAFRNIFSCLLSFYVGMLIFKHALYENKLVALVSAFVLAALYVAPIPVSENLSAHLCGIALFFVLNYVGQIVMELSPCCKITSWLASISYEVFLIHSLVIQATLMVLPLGGVRTLVAFAVVLLLTVICSYGLLWGTKLLMTCVGRCLSLTRQGTDQ